MATRTVTCPSCGSVGPDRRLSCAACGTLLASVAGSNGDAPGAPPASVAGSAASHAPVAVAGAYLPPSAVFATSPDGRVTAASVAAAEQRDARPASRRRAGLLADLPLAEPGDVAEWLIALGAGAAAVGFVLPWADNGMIGGGVDAGFFSRWGLANAANAVPLALALIVLWLEVGSTGGRSATRSGAIGIGLGAALLGIAFVYATSPFGLGTGGLVVGLGSAALVFGGTVALAARHATTDPSV